MLPLCWCIPLHTKSHLFLLQRKLSRLPSWLLLYLLLCLPFSSKMPEPRSLQPTSLLLPVLLPKGVAGCLGPQSRSLQTKGSVCFSSDAAVSGIVSKHYLKRFLLRGTINQSVLPSWSLLQPYRGSFHTGSLLLLSLTRCWPPFSLLCVEYCSGEHTPSPPQFSSPCFSSLGKSSFEA